MSHILNGVKNLSVILSVSAVRGTATPVQLSRPHPHQWDSHSWLSFLDLTSGETGAWCFHRRRGVTNKCVLYLPAVARRVAWCFPPSRPTPTNGHSERNGGQPFLRPAPAGRPSCSRRSLPLCHPCLGVSPSRLGKESSTLNSLGPADARLKHLPGQSLCAAPRPLRRR